MSPEAKALQEHIKTSGTGDVQKIARLRRASLQADATPSSQAAQAREAAMMASAVASIQEEPEVLSVTFTEAGSLGLKFTPNKLTGNTEVLAVNPGTQAERHRELHAGLILKSVGKVGVMKNT